jgi:hypothetical protein
VITAGAQTVESKPGSPLNSRYTKIDMRRNGISFEQKAEWMRERQSAVARHPLAVEPSGFRERHYTVAEIAALWNLSSDAVRKIFQDEPGVLVLSKYGSHKRRYTTLRIPESVFQRVHRRMTNI